MTTTEARFSATATPEPGMLIRMLNLFAVRDHVPARVRSRVVGGLLLVDIDAGGLAEPEADLVAARMRALVGVVGVRVEQLVLSAAA
jgi:hypothetical protein